MDFIQVLTVVLLWNIIEPSYSSKPCEYTRYSNWYVNLTCNWTDVAGLHDNSHCTDVRGYIIEYWRIMSPSRVYNITVNESSHHTVSLHVSYYTLYQVAVRVKCEYNETVMIGSRSFLLNISKENTPDITGFSPVGSYMVENINNIDMRCYDGLIEYNYILNFGVGLWVNDIGTHFGEKELNNQDNDITTSIFTKDATYSHKLNGVVVNRVLFPESVGVRRIGVKYMWTKSNGIVASISMVFLAKNAPIVAAEEHRTISTSIGESIELVVTTSDTVNTNNLKWKKDGIIDISEWDGLSNVTIENVRRKDDGIYECYQEGHRDEGQHAIVRVIVRECPRGKWFPPDCELDCPVCYNGGVCTEFGSCICPPGFKGYNCEKACGNNLWGRNCTIICTTKAKPNKCKQGNLHCLPDPYGCSCFTGFKGIECDKDCNTATTGRYGANCLMECHCDTSDCSQTEGCAEGAQCNSNYTGETCLEMKSNVTCSEGFYGPECAKRCHCKHSSTCNRTSGRCPDGDHCAEGWAGLGCQQALPALSDAPVVETFDNEVKVYWSSWKPNNDYGQGTVTSYQLLFWATNTTNDKHLNITNGVEANVSWTHMKYHTEYSFVVKVFTGVGQTLELGKASPAAKHTIYPPSLLRPPSLQSRGSLGVNITWDEWTYVFEKGIGNVTAYVIEWWNAVYTYNISASMYTGDPSEGILIPNITYDTILVVTIRTMYVDGSGEQKGEASPVLVILKDKCPYDWKLFEDTCYLLDGSLLNWNDANAFCQKQNASLVSIASQSENAYIKQLAQDKSYDYIWIGLNFQIFSSNWYWSTEEILLYQNWQQGTPDIALGECAYFNTSSGLWSSMLCQSNNTVICQKGVQHFGCLDETWYGYKDECYKYFNNRTTHDEAAQSCRSFRNADQASIHSLDEDEFVQTIIRNFCNETWLGLHYSKTFDLQWTDGTDVDYNYNTNIDVHNQCAAYSQDDHIFSWKFMNCSTQNAYVCKDIRVYRIYRLNKNKKT